MFTREFWKAAITRAVKTMAQTAVGAIGASTIISDVDWQFILSASALAGILSILTSIAAGLPEVEDGIEDEEDEIK